MTSSADGNVYIGVGGGGAVPTDDSGTDEVASPGVVIPQPGPAPRANQPPCASDADCGSGQFCDRGTVCIAPVGGGQLGNDCTSIGDGIHSPCGSYVCVDEVCRSCVSDAECSVGESCLDIGEYGKWCAEPKVPETPASPPATSATGLPPNAVPVSCSGLDSELCAMTAACFWYQGTVYDSARDCLLLGEFCSERCTSDGALVTFTKDPDGRPWRFNSTCIPPDWSVGASLTPMAREAFESDNWCSR